MPSQPSEAPRRRQLSASAASLILAGGLAAIFLIPYAVPVAPAKAESYLFGYSNRTAELLLVALAAGTALLVHQRWIVLPTSLGAEDSAAEGRLPLLQPSVAALGAMLGLTAVLSGVIFWLVHAAHGYGESVYFLDRIGLLAQGQRPYREFEFAYGPLTLYGPWLLSKALHLSLTHGYSSVWLLSSLLGIALLWASLRLLELPVAGKRAVFLLLSAVLLGTVPSTGLNYNPLRYTAPLFALLTVDRISRQASAFLSQTLRRSTGKLVLTAALLSAFVVGVSPEEGLTFSIAVMLLLPLRRRLASQPVAALTFGLALSQAALLAASWQLGTFRTMANFSGGAFNLPVLPGPQILIFFASLLLLVAYVARRPLHSQVNGQIALITLYSLGMIPGALGRCDWIHVIGYELGAVACALLLLWPMRWPRRVAMCAVGLPVAFGLVQIALGTAAGVVKVQLYRMLAYGDPTDSFGRLIVAHTRVALVRNFGAAEGAEKFERIRAVAKMQSFDPHVLFPAAFPVVAVPFSYSPQRLGVVQAPAIAEGAYMGSLNLFTPKQVEEKIGELREHPERDLVLPREGFNECAVLTGDPAELRQLFMLPFAPQPRHTYDPLGPLCRYILNNSRQVVAATPQTGDYGLWRRVPR